MTLKKHRATWGDEAVESRLRMSTESTKVESGILSL